MNPQLCLYFVAWPNHNVIMKNANETIRHQVEVTANHLFTFWISHFQIEKRREKKNRKKIYEKRLTAHDKQKREKKECHRIFFFFLSYDILHEMNHHAFKIISKEINQEFNNFFFCLSLSSLLLFRKCRVFLFPFSLFLTPKKKMGKS